MCLPHRSPPPPLFWVYPSSPQQPSASLPRLGQRGCCATCPPQSAAASLSLLRSVVQRWRGQCVSRMADDIRHWEEIAGKTAGFLASSEKGIQVKDDSWQCDENKGFNSASGIQKINILPAEVFCLSHLAFFHATTKTQMFVSIRGKVSSFKGCTRHVGTWIWMRATFIREHLFDLIWSGLEMMQHKFYLRTKGLSGGIWHLFMSFVCWGKERFL